MSSDLIANTTGPSYFPRDVVIDILSRLPIKSVLQFRCVSKLWNSAYNDPCFANLHKTHYHVQPRNSIILSLLKKDSSEQYILTIDENGGPAKRLLTLSTLKPFRVSESLNGVICLFRYYDTISYLENRAFKFNPTTRKINSLPVDPKSSWNDLDRFYNTYWFGFDICRKQYKVLNIRVNCMTRGVGDCKILTLETNSWKRIMATPVLIDALWLVSYKNCVFLNSTLHWLFEQDYENQLIVFNFVNDSFQYFRVPYLRNNFRHSKDWQIWPSLIQVDGCLAVPNFIDDWTIKLQILTDYHNQVWSEETISLPQNPCLVPVGSIHTGEILLIPGKVCFGPMEIFYYDLKRTSLRSVVITDIPRSMFSSGLTFPTFVINHPENIVMDY